MLLYLRSLAGISRLAEKTNSNNMEQNRESTKTIQDKIQTCIDSCATFFIGKEWRKGSYAVFFWGEECTPEDYFHSGFKLGRRGQLGTVYFNVVCTSLLSFYYLSAFCWISNVNTKYQVNVSHFVRFVYIARFKSVNRIQDSFPTETYKCNSHLISRALSPILHSNISAFKAKR